jgi:hypothetical protein
VLAIAVHRRMVDRHVTPEPEHEPRTQNLEE